MSIYATLWHVKLPILVKSKRRRGYWDEAWVEVYAQGVPAHIDYELPYLPPPVEDHDESNLRAVVFVTDTTRKGTKKHGQKYIRPLLTLTGDEYEARGFGVLGELEDILEARLSRPQPPTRAPRGKDSR